MIARRALLTGAAVGLGAVLVASRWHVGSAVVAAPALVFPVAHTDAEWRKLLTAGPI